MTFPGGIYVPEGGGIILIGEAFDSREAYRLTRALWERGVNRIRYCVVKPSRLRRHHGVYYLLARISVEEVICSPYLLAAYPGSAEPLGARRRVVRAVSRGDSLENGSWRLEILAPVYPPLEGAVVSRADAGISCRLEIKCAAGRTTLDLKEASGYHAVP